MGINWSKRHRHHHRPPLPPSSSSPDTTSPTIPHPTPTTTLPQPSPPPNSSNLHPPPSPPPPLPPPTATTQSAQPPPPPPSTATAQSTPPPSYAFAANAPHPAIPQPERIPYPALPPPSVFPPPQPSPPPPPLPPYSYNNYNCNNFSGFYPRPMNNAGPYSNYRPYYFPHMNGWGPSAAPLPPPLPPPITPVPYVDHQSAKKIKNDVNVHKDTIRLHSDVQNQDSQLVSFTFDALVDGSITIFYFAKEGPLCSFTPVYPEIVPVKIPFTKGLGQKFCQISGTGVDLGFFSTDDLSKPSPGEDVYPLVISAESHGPNLRADGQSSQELTSASPHAQISQAVLEKKSDGSFEVKVMKQILWVEGVRYELREIFGISNSGETTVNDVDLGKECVICMTEAKNTAVLPCRHLCMCSECAKELRLQSNKCPICRQPIEELLEIKVDEEVGA